VAHCTGARCCDRRKGKESAKEDSKNKTQQDTRTEGREEKPKGCCLTHARVEKDNNKLCDSQAVVLIWGRTEKKEEARRDARTQRASTHERREGKQQTTQKQTER
jgi:hypothetical protein